MLALRGAASTNFRAPSLAQVGFQNTTSNFGDGGTLTDIRVLSVNDPIARALGAESLDPETSKNFSLGLTAQLNDRFDLSFDVFRIDVDDRITLSQRIGSDAMEQFIQDNFGVAGVHDVNFFTNAPDTRTDGAERAWHADADPELVDYEERLTRHNRLDVFKALVSQASWLPEGELERLLLPVRIVSGDSDGLTPAERALALHERLPNSHFEVLENCGHQLMQEKPQAINRHLRELLAS